MALQSRISLPLQGLAGKHVALTVTPSQDVIAREMEAPATNGAGAYLLSSVACDSRLDWFVYTDAKRVPWLPILLQTN